MQCDTEECVEAHTNIDVVVNVTAVENILQKAVQSVTESLSMDQVDFEWP